MLSGQGYTYINWSPWLHLFEKPPVVRPLVFYRKPRSRDGRHCKARPPRSLPLGTSPRPLRTNDNAHKELRIYRGSPMLLLSATALGMLGCVIDLRACKKQLMVQR